MNERSRIHLPILSLMASALCAIAALGSAPAALAQQQSGLSISAGLAQTGEPRFFAIKDARIVPVSGPVIEKGTVVMANGIITAVGADVLQQPVPDSGHRAGNGRPLRLDEADERLGLQEPVRHYQAGAR